MNRNPRLWQEAVALTDLGFTIDITAFPKSSEERSAGEYLAEYFDRGLASDKLTMSSDGGGCLPSFNEDGEMTKMGIGSSSTLFGSIREAQELGAPLPKLLATCTLNAASLYRFVGRGQLKTGNIADVLVCSNDLSVEVNLAEGKFFSS